ncbi:MAG: DUF3800 domain-containing protein [Desulfobacterales bacterium]|nr:DUF3800 domain-containing protein [Desulfobacterales bacterium]
MYIYIDESGIFANPNGKDTAVSCVAALVIPEPFQKYIFKSLKHLKKNWGSTREETKGSRLDERQVAQVATLLGKYDVILKACVIDMGTHSDSDIAAHKQGQAEAFTKNITPEFHPNLVRQLEELKERVRRLPDQLYVQSCVLTSLVESIIKVSTLYYCQRVPSTLASFRWVIDAKADKVTDYEQLWSTVVMPFLQSSSLTKPMICLKGGDYSWFQRKFDMTMPTPPNHLKPGIRSDEPVEPFHCSDVKKIMTENLSFASSEKELGLQLADIAANAIRRALQGNLQFAGWRDLGKVMVENESGKRTVTMLALHNDAVTGKVPYAPVLEYLEKQAKPMLSAEFVGQHGLK